jgi:DNA-binding PadR family transcriptional regulator
MAERDRRDPRLRLPLTPAEFQLLIALADEELHGYAILKEVARRSGGEVKLSPATLYTILRRFVGEGILAESAERPGPALDDERRRYFRITEYGRRVAGAEADRMEAVLEMARSRNLVRRPRPA